MFLTVISLSAIILFYYRLDSGILKVVEEGEKLAEQRTELFQVFAEYITYLVLGFYSVNTMQKGKWFNNTDHSNNNNNNNPE